MKPIAHRSPIILTGVTLAALMTAGCDGAIQDSDYAWTTDPLSSRTHQSSRLSATPRRASRADVLDDTPEPCLEPGDPYDDAYAVVTGPADDGILLPNGRALTPFGDQLEVDTFPVNVISDAEGRYAYVMSIGKGTRSVQQIDMESWTVSASFERSNLFHGLALSADGSTLYAAGGEDDLVYVLDVGAPGLSLVAEWQVPGYPTGLALSPDGERLLVTGNLNGIVYELDADTGGYIHQYEVNQMPYQVIYAPDGEHAYVSIWSRKEIDVLDLKQRKVGRSLRTERNPSGMVLSPSGDKLYVAAADGDVIDVFRTSDNRRIGRIPVGVYADEGLRGVSPNTFALSPDGLTLYVVNAADNALEVYDAQSLTFQGAVPTGWYPSGVVLTPTNELLVTNAKGEGAGPNPGQWDAAKMKGTLSRIALPLDGATLEDGAQQVRTNNARPKTLHEINCAGKMFPIPSEGGTTPIEHVVFILRENKTYDAYLGDLEVGDGDPDLVLFGEEITPNTHELARRFTVLDNFYTDSEDSDQGHLWTTASFVNDYSERVNAAGRLLLTGVGSGSDSDMRYIFDNLLEQGIDWINYGEVVGLEAATMSNIDFNYPGVFYNTDIKDEVKAEYVVSQIEAFDAEGEMPSFIYLLLPNDHTNGTEPGALSPESMVSDNDYAVGLVVDAISKSQFWPSTVIFILEDDPQTGADHIDAHRSPAIVVSPWAKRNYVSSVLYSIPSIHRSIELILGMPPLTQYDAWATPMYDCFTATPDYTPYDVIPRQIPDTYNTLATYGAEESSRMDFSGPDRNPGLGALLWRYRKGTEPPVSSNPDHGFHALVLD